MTDDFKVRAGIAISNNPGPILERFLPGSTAVRVGRQWRIEPCECTHRGCCNLTIDTPYIHCFSCGLGGYSVDFFRSKHHGTDIEFFAFLTEAYGV